VIQVTFQISETSHRDNHFLPRKPLKIDKIQRLSFDSRSRSIVEAALSDTTFDSIKKLKETKFRNVFKLFL